MQAREHERAKAQAPLCYETGSRERRNLDSVVGIVPGLQAGKYRVRKWARATDNSLLHGVQSESGSCSASCSMSTDESLTRRWNGQSSKLINYLQVVRNLEMAETVGLPPIPNMPSRHAQGKICDFSTESEPRDMGTEIYSEACGSNVGRTKAEGSVWSSLTSLSKRRDIISN